MAILASGGKAGVVYRAGGRVVVVLMAADAGSARQIVVVVDVAIGAGARRHGVRSRENKSGS